MATGVASRPAGGRPLPQPTTIQGTPISFAEQAGNASSAAQRLQESIWYEAQELHRPSYIAPQPQRPPNHGGARTPSALPPLSPSARYAQQQYPFPEQSQAPHNGQRGNLPPGAAPPSPPSTSTAEHQYQGGLNGISSSASSATGVSFATAPLNSSSTSLVAHLQPLTPSSPLRAPVPSHSQASSKRNSFSGNLAALAVQATSKLRRNSNNLAVPGYGDAEGGTPLSAATSASSWTRTVGSRGQKGSAFMHKGFWDIMSLVNNNGANENAGASFLAAPRSISPSGRISPNGGAGTSRFMASVSKATAALRRKSGVFGGASPQSTPSGPEELIGGPKFNDLGALQQQPSYTSSPGPQLAAPIAVRAAKKRISIDMVGAPQANTFVHAAHASDVDQAEAILRRWCIDGAGFAGRAVADPHWVEPIKEEMRQQAAYNQAAAIARIQAAMHEEQEQRVALETADDSTLTVGGRGPLQVVNGAPSNLTTSTVTTLSSATVTVGHTAPSHLVLSPPLPRSNTRGTTILASPTAGKENMPPGGPDYMRFKPPSPEVELSSNPLAAAASPYDGLPTRGIGALFIEPAPALKRPDSMIVRDAAAAQAHATAGKTAAPTATGELGASGFVLARLGADIRPSLTTVEKSVAAKIFFENFYYGILKKPRARDTRRNGLEAELAALRLPEHVKAAIRARWAANETEYLRDLRARVGANSFTKLKTIGHGAFGVVALVREKQSGGLYAMKQLRKADMLRKGQEGHVRAERYLMTSASASASAKWIVKLMYSFQDSDHLYLIMEFMGGGDLLNLLIEKDVFPEDFARFYVAEMILGIHEAHRFGYIHRDIKPDNFLFTNEGHIKLADFGLCQSFHWAHDGAYYDQQRKHLLRKHGIDLDEHSATHRRIDGGAARMNDGAQGGGKLTDKELNDLMSDRNEDGTPVTHVLTWRDKNKKKIAYSVVGTNNYMAVEVLRGRGYDQSCDWWSLGVIVFEMLYGYPPFVSKSRHLTRQKILNWRQTLRFPPKPRVSKEAQDFIARLICEKEDRLGSASTASVSRPNSMMQGARRSGFQPAAGMHDGLQDGVDELMSHPWFRSIDWQGLHASSPPFQPALAHPADTKHFEDDIEDAPLAAPGAANNPNADQPRDPMLRDKAHGEHLLQMRKQLAFVGYTFKSPKAFDPREQLMDESIIEAAERAAGMTAKKLGHLAANSVSTSRIRSMSM